MGKLSILFKFVSKNIAKGDSMNSYKLTQNHKKSKITFTFIKCHLSC